jgi:hypothetical protein
MSIKHDSKIILPPRTTRVKISVGESDSAPNPALWLKNTADPYALTVFGFEPNPDSCSKIRSSQECFVGGCMKVPMEMIDVQYFLTCVAVGSSQQDPMSLRTQTFYSTDGDPGTSSLNQPTRHVVKREVQVPEITLERFFALLPWSEDPLAYEMLGVSQGNIRYVDMLKIDAQGHDLKILKGAGRWLSERVVWVQPEMVVEGYSSQHSPEELSSYMSSIGFEHVASRGTRAELQCNDDLFLNSRLKHLGHIAHVMCGGSK